VPFRLHHRFACLARRVVFVVAAAIYSTACYAQGCAYCYSQAASSGFRIIQGLRSGILVLVIPPMFMSVAITVLAYRKRNQFQRPDLSSKNQRDFGW
jgi:hypothetical protein